MAELFSRRELLIAGGAAAGLAVSGAAAGAAFPEIDDPPRFRYCLNTSTIRGQNLTLPEEIDIAARAGYDGIEPWIREIEQYEQQGGSLQELAARIRDAGLAVESAIGFAPWIVDDEQERNKGLEQAKREMELVRRIGGSRIAAPPAGATRQPDLNLFRAAERYRDLLEVGRNVGVIPQLELWGFSQSLSRLGEVALVAVESGHPDACVLPDVYHIYKGGSDFTGLRLLSGRAMHAFHVNDYPGEPPRAEITDADRVYPGDGVAPLTAILRTLTEIGFRGTLSLELFNRDYWRQDAAAVATTGLEKIRAAVERAFAG